MSIVRVFLSKPFVSDEINSCRPRFAFLSCFRTPCDIELAGPPGPSPPGRVGCEVLCRVVLGPVVLVGPPCACLDQITWCASVVKGTSSYFLLSLCLCCSVPLENQTGTEKKAVIEIGTGVKIVAIEMLMWIVKETEETGTGTVSVIAAMIGKGEGLVIVC